MSYDLVYNYIYEIDYPAPLRMDSSILDIYLFEFSLKYIKYIFDNSTVDEKINYMLYQNINKNLINSVNDYMNKEKLFYLEIVNKIKDRVKIGMNIINVKELKLKNVKIVYDCNFDKKEFLQTNNYDIHSIYDYLTNISIYNQYTFNPIIMIRQFEIIDKNDFKIRDLDYISLTYNLNQNMDDRQTIMSLLKTYLNNEDKKYIISCTHPKNLESNKPLNNRIKIMFDIIIYYIFGINSRDYYFRVNGMNIKPSFTFKLNLNELQNYLKSNI